MNITELIYDLQREKDETKLKEMIVEYADSIREFKHQYLVTGIYGKFSRDIAVRQKVPNASDLLKTIQDNIGKSVKITGIFKL